ncbi:aspartate/glutamate racemase family protein [Puniceibacterium sp. IMCC21224]|uniref:aspartate/glutamate racemase family protein n=1 Tax=Puniceibacterium sp. IMCC21224 TaxID=1618204 RepID=UPI00064D9DD6|nr:aspartate/glutamate racemase family protein [Puniceibacterium sp. IMCC21224]KMK68290.1 aspartate racemase [Puniceibacterium sp. IMCC21224]
MNRVGILGGMGPQATILLMQKLIDAVPATDDADHIPLIVHQNPQVPSRIAALIDGTGPDPTPVLIRMAQDLAAAGATALAMPCNTAHHYAPALRAATPLQLLDMLTATARTLRTVGTIGILASPATRLTDVFAGYFPDQTLLYAQDDAPMLSMIRAIKAGGTPSSILDAMTSQALALLDQGADHLLVACTELSLTAPLLPATIPRTDSLDCLTQAILDHAKDA